MKKLLWLDDKRNPFLNLDGKVPSGEKYEIHWVLNYDQFTRWLGMFGLPDVISFDHDLAEEHYTPEFFWDNYDESERWQKWKSKYYKENTGFDCARWLFQYCTNTGSDLPEVYVHSDNPVGADNIRSLLNKFKPKTKINHG